MNPQCHHTAMCHGLGRHLQVTSWRPNSNVPPAKNDFPDTGEARTARRRPTATDPWLISQIQLLHLYTLIIYSGCGLSSTAPGFGSHSVGVLDEESKAY